MSPESLKFIGDEIRQLGAAWCLSASDIALIGSVSIIVFLYVVKAFLARIMAGNATRAIVFITAVLLCIPITWIVSSEWDNWHVNRYAVYVGMPVKILTIPCVSFFLDCTQRARKRRHLTLRTMLEILIGVPVWTTFWTFLEVAVFEWIWI